MNASQTIFVGDMLRLVLSAVHGRTAVFSSFRIPRNINERLERIIAGLWPSHLMRSALLPTPLLFIEWNPLLEGNQAGHRSVGLRFHVYLNRDYSKKFKSSPLDGVEPSSLALHWLMPCR